MNCEIYQDMLTVYAPLLSGKPKWRPFSILREIPKEDSIVAAVDFPLLLLIIINRY